jgi:hypothetical protein
MTFSPALVDSDWGCTYQEVVSAIGHANIRVCLVKVTKLDDFATRISEFVLETSWMTGLDHGVKRAYSTTVRETAAALVKVFKDTTAVGVIGTEFGETMVSIGSARALEKIFDHKRIPLAELWKPQVKQNEGFDFHTVCTGEFINFGEAKYSGSSSPHGLAITQADDFIGAEKHLRDRVHLINLVSKPAIDQLDNDKYGVVAAFSVNASNPLTVLKNAAQSATAVVSRHAITNFYLVGVSDEC